jgi:DNA-binding transcriptional LysR family regulator
MHNLHIYPMDLKRLDHLVALADARNFSRAAERVHLTQPAFSRSVQAAEAELGLQLFDRGSREVTCTVAGSFVIDRARKLLFDSRCLERDVSLYREGLAGDISFGVGPYLSATLLPQLMIELRGRFAGVSSRVEVNNWKYLVEHLRAEELEFCASDIRDVPRDPDLAVTNIGRLRGGFYARKGHPLLSRKNPRPAELARHGIASVKLPAEIRAAFKKMLRLGANGSLPIVVECDDVNLLKRVSLATDTVLACPRAAVREEAGAGQLQEIVLRDVPPLFSSVGVVALKGRSFSPMAQYAVDCLGKLVARLDP